MTKALPVAPSSTAIKRVIRDVGDFFEKRGDEVEEVIARDAPLADSANLVISWDGVMVPVRGDGKTEWKEAGIGRISAYDPPTDGETRPQLRDSRYFARMPETGMKTLIDQVAARVAALREERQPAGGDHLRRQGLDLDYRRETRGVRRCGADPRLLPRRPESLRRRAGDLRTRHSRGLTLVRESSRAASARRRRRRQTCCARSRDT
ncbi:MAG: hypothetical protein IPM29_11625 [Planctomycetes bacterium]|nr:hypothetical protein [Planctomycetota bacterium]